MLRKKGIIELEEELKDN